MDDSKLTRGQKKYLKLTAGLFLFGWLCIYVGSAVLAAILPDPWWALALIFFGGFGYFTGKTGLIRVLIHAWDVIWAPL